MLKLAVRIRLFLLVNVGEPKAIAYYKVAKKAYI